MPLAFYSINSNKPAYNSDKFLIGTPLFIISLFCFSYLLMQPLGHSQIVQASKKASPVFASHLGSALSTVHVSSPDKLPLVTTSSNVGSLSTAAINSSANVRSQPPAKLGHKQLLAPVYSSRQAGSDDSRSVLKPLAATNNSALTASHQPAKKHYLL